MGSALGEVGTRTILSPHCGTTIIQAITPVTATGGADSVTVDLNDFGCTLIHGILGFKEATTGQVVTVEQPTTAVASGVATITLTGSGAAVRTLIIFAY